jgi:hypothetical protein
MTVVVFTGPTLDHATASQLLPATYLPPAAAGDIYRVARAKPSAIGIIDGVFHTVASIFHKEILWALDRGVPVFGAASMGALRAAETRTFGMVGVGAIFEAFDRGDLTDDDEVAVSHLGADDGFRATSEAMVNIRATLAAAVVAGVVEPDAAAVLATRTKARFYPERSLRAVVAEVRGDAISNDAACGLVDWLAQGGFVDQKRLDAERLLETLASCIEPEAPPRPVTFPFANTAFFEALRSEVDRAHPVERGGLADGGERHLMTEVQLDPGFRHLYDAALATVLARRAARREGYALDASSLQQVAGDFWEQQHVQTPDEVDAWMSARRLDDAGLSSVVLDYAYREWARGTERHNIKDALHSLVLELSSFTQLRDRSERKQRFLEAAGLCGMPHPVDIGDDELWQWWFARRGEPGAVNLTTYARTLGFAEDAHLRTAVIDEYHFMTRAGRSLRDEDIRVAAAEPATTPRATLSARLIEALVRANGSGEAPLSDDDIVRVQP